MKGNKDMNKELEKWLKNNPPRVELTDFEKNLVLEDVDYLQHEMYFDEIGTDRIYRFKVANNDDRFKYHSKEGIKHGVENFLLLWKSLDFCPLGYGQVELNALNNTYGQLYRSVNC